MRADNPITQGYCLRGSVEGIKYTHKLQFNRDYAEHFIKWFAKRRSFYITNEHLCSIWLHLIKKWGRGLARNGPSRPMSLNSKFGAESSGDFCAISVYDSKPVYGESCRICHAVTSAKVSNVNSVFTFVGLTDHPKLLRDNQLIEIESYHSYLESELTPTGLCKDPQCSELDAWINNNSPDSEKARQLSIQINKPAKATLAKQPSCVIKPFIGARYLDFKARLKIAENKLIEAQ